MGWRFRCGLLGCCFEIGLFWVSWKFVVSRVNYVCMYGLDFLLFCFIVAVLFVVVGYGWWLLLNWCFRGVYVEFCILAGLLYLGNIVVDSDGFDLWWWAYDYVVQGKGGCYVFFI